MQPGERIILNANLGKTNVSNFDDFSNITIKTLTDIVESIVPLCGVDALHDLVIYKDMANQYLANIFSNDGIYILKKIEYLNPMQTFIANMIRYVAERVEQAAADGTSTAIYLAANLVIAALKEVQHIRNIHPRTEDDDIILDNIQIMRKTREVSDDVIDMLKSLLDKIGNFVIKFDDIDVELKKALIYQLAYTTSKQDKLLTEFAVELYKDLPPFLYGYSHWRREKNETDESIRIERPDYDFILNVTPASNIEYNAKLGTELLLENCDLLICPRLFDCSDELMRYLKYRADSRKDSPECPPLVIVYSGADERIDTQIVLNSDKNVILLRHTSYTGFANNPLELNVLQAVCGIDPHIQMTADEFSASVIRNRVKCKLVAKDLFFYNLFEHGTSTLHPSYEHPSEKTVSYNRLAAEIDARITELKTAHNKQDNGHEIDELVRIYRSMVCSRIPTLVLGGSSVDHMSGINVVQDVMGVVSVAMQHGVILDLIPKFRNLTRVYKNSYPADWSDFFDMSILQFCRLTYRREDVFQKLMTHDLGTHDMRDYFFSPDYHDVNKFLGTDIKCDDAHGDWIQFDQETKDKVTVVQSYRAISETINRLIEIVPRIICTDKIIVPDSVMDT